MARVDLSSYMGCNLSIVWTSNRYFLGKEIRDGLEAQYGQGTLSIGNIQEREVYTFGCLVPTQSAHLVTQQEQQQPQEESELQIQYGETQFQNQHHYKPIEDKGWQITALDVIKWQSKEMWMMPLPLSSGESFNSLFSALIAGHEDQPQRHHVMEMSASQANTITTFVHKSLEEWYPTKINRIFQTQLTETDDEKSQESEDDAQPKIYEFLFSCQQLIPIKEYLITQRQILRRCRTHNIKRYRRLQEELRAINEVKFHAQQALCQQDNRIDDDVALSNLITDLPLLQLSVNASKPRHQQPSPVKRQIHRQDINNNKDKDKDKNKDDKHDDDDLTAIQPLESDQRENQLSLDFASLGFSKRTCRRDVVIPTQ
jgi:hypothetical protein